MRNIKSELEKLYWDYMKARWKECMDKRLKVRLVIDFNNGQVMSIQNQEILAGATLISYALDNS